MKNKKSRKKSFSKERLPELTFSKKEAIDSAVRAAREKSRKKPIIKRTRKPAEPPKQSTPNPRDVALDLAAEIHKKFSDLVKATILFGSQAKSTAGPNSDIDIIIIIDDASINWDMELIAWYREELGKLIAASGHNIELHVNTIKLTTWWNDLMHGDPVVINILRYGEALIDIGGFFNPQKALLLQGRIHSTPEAVYEALQRAPTHLARSKASEMNSIEGVYWAMVDSSQAALMTFGLLPPSPEHIPAMLKDHLVDKKLLDIEMVKWQRDIHVFHKGIVHGNIRNIKGADIDIWQERANTFIKKMTEIIDKVLEERRK